MNFIIEEIPSSKIAYIRRVGAYGVDNVQIMEKLKSWAKSKCLLDENAVILGIPQDNPTEVASNECRYDACIIVPYEYKINSGGCINEGYTPHGKYAVFQVEHTSEALQKAWTNIFPALQKENISFDISKPIIERYKVKMVKNHFCEICVAII